MADFNFGVIDLLQIDLPDEDYTYAQVESNREDENLNKLFKFPFQADNYGLQIGDFDSTPSASFGYVKTYASLLASLGVDDTLFVYHAVETLAILLTLSRVDELKILLADDSPTIAVILSRIDELLPKIDDTRSIASTLSRADTLFPKIDEQLAILSRLSRQDILLPLFIDTLEAAIGNMIAVSDELKPYIISSLNILSSLARTDELLPKIDEAISSAGTMTADDILRPKIDEANTILSSLLRADTLFPKVDEAIAILNSFNVSDELKPLLLELAEILWLTLEAFRFRNDDGSEATATWIAGQDVSINRASETMTRLRLILDTNSDAPGLQLKLQYRPVGDPDWEWRDIV